MSQNVLLVEGADDWAVALALWNARALPARFCPEDMHGKEALLKSLPVYLKDPKAYPTVGVLLDADENLAATWEAVAGRLNSNGYQIPAQFPADGLVLEHPQDNGARVGVWLMPNNQLPGMLEDFVRWLVPRDDDLVPEADRVLDAIEDQGAQRYSGTGRPKAFIHTWLAWQRVPGRPIGAAITAGYLDPVSPHAERFVAWLARLYPEE